MSTEFYRDYDNCVRACEGDDLEDCISAIRTENNDQSLCTKIEKNDCEIINSDNFRNLIIFLIKFLQFLYCIRSHHNNKYDELIISSISKINLSDFNLSLDELLCVEFPGDKSLVNQFPHNLTEYIIIMTKMSEAVKSGEILESFCKTDEILSKFDNFCSDYQPWSRTLTTFVNIHSQRLFGTSIPRIESILDYGNFITDCDKNISKFDLLIQNKSIFDIELINFLKFETRGGNIYKTRKYKTRKYKTRKYKTRKYKTRKYKTRKYKTRKYKTRKYKTRKYI